MSAFPYRTVFDAIEDGLLEVGSALLPRSTIESRLSEYKHVADKTLTDEDYFWVLVQVAFYSGFRAATVTSRLAVIRKHFPNWKTVADYTTAQIDAIAADPNMISHLGKISACVSNAKIFAQIIAEFGSIKKYIDSFNPQASFENLFLLKESLEGAFAYLGGISAMPEAALA
jgi:DNA-3-methyladenine glycosylase I